MNEVTTSFKDVLDTKYAVTLFEGVRKPQGKLIEPSYRKFIQNLSNLIVSEAKNTVALSPCRFKGGHRNDDNV